MKLNKALIGITIPMMGFVASCDNIDIKDRYEITEIETTNKTLLIMEFTGNNCVNCPKGAASLHNIMDTYNVPDTLRVITVGLHPEGGGANTRPLAGQDFRCEEAQVIYEIYKPSAFPTAVFNGITQSSSYADWLTEATKMLTYNPNDPSTWRNEPKMSIHATTEYDSATRNVKVNYSIKMTKDMSDPLNVMVWIMENDIIGYQMDGGTLLDDYVHNHVLRASLNGPMGESLSGFLVEDQVIEGTAEMIIDEKWVAENCQIVVYVFNTDDYFVEQATLADIN